MKDTVLYRYARRLSRHIDDRRAREETAEEIYSHLCEMADGYAAQGMTRQEAERQAVREMRPPDELGAQMDRVHTPKIRWRFYGLVAALLLAALLGMLAYLNSYADRAGQGRVMPDKEAAFYEKEWTEVAVL